MGKYKFTTDGFMIMSQRGNYAVAYKLRNDETKGLKVWVLQGSTPIFSYKTGEKNPAKNGYRCRCSSNMTEEMLPQAVRDDVCLFWRRHNKYLQEYLFLLQQRPAQA